MPGVTGPDDARLPVLRARGMASLAAHVTQCRVFVSLVMRERLPSQKIWLNKEGVTTCYLCTQCWAPQRSVEATQREKGFGQNGLLVSTSASKSPAIRKRQDSAVPQAVDEEMKCTF